MIKWSILKHQTSAIFFLFVTFGKPRKGLVMAMVWERCNDSVGEQHVIIQQKILDETNGFFLHLEFIVMTIDCSIVFFLSLSLLRAAKRLFVRNRLYRKLFHAGVLGGRGCMCSAAWWSAPLRDMIRALLLSNDATLGWLTSQLTDSALLVSSG